MPSSHYGARTPRYLSSHVGLHAAKRPVSCPFDYSAVDALVAACHARLALAERILDRDESLSQRQSSWGETPIEAASHLGHKALVWRIIEAGAELDLFAACALADEAAVMSRYNPTCPDVCGVHGLPLLHFAIMGGEAAILKTLLAAGVEINPRRASLPPLHSAVASGRRDLVSLLLDAGADTTACDAYGANALDWARELDGAESISTQQLLVHELGGVRMA
jgi:ankyrin repeat protein